MPKVLQIIDVDSEGFKVRLDDGSVIRMPHGGEHPRIGQEVSGATGQGQSPSANAAAEQTAPEAPDSLDEPLPSDPAQVN